MGILSPEKIKCPKCGNKLLKKILKATDGRCNNCGYLLTNSILTFIPGKVQVEVKS